MQLNDAGTVLWLTLGHTSFITSELETNNNFDNSM